MYMFLLQANLPSNLSYLSAAYFVAWIMLFGYLIFIAKKRRSLEITLENIKNEDKEL